MPKSKWDNAEEPTIIKFNKIRTDNFECALLCMNRTHYHNYQPQLTVILLGDKCPLVPRVHQQRHMPSGKNKLEPDFQIIITIY